MTNIDIEKFIVSMIQQLKDGHPLRINILYALLNQGLIYTGDSIVRVVNKKEGPSLEEAITNEPVVKRKSDPSSTIPFEWSEEDKAMIDKTLYFINEYQKSNRCKDENSMQNSVTCEYWLKSLKDRVQPQNTWKSRVMSRWRPYLKQKMIV